MPEQFDLTSPIVGPSRSSYKIATVLLDWAQAVIRVDLVGNDAVPLTVVYTGPEATALMTALNTANLTTNSLYRRVLTKLATDGKIPAGSVSGTPA